MATKIRTKNVTVEMDLDDLIKGYQSEAEKQTTRNLVNYAKDKIQKAYSEKTFTDQTYNLRDSYVWVVYLGGVIQDYGFIDNTPKATEPQFEQGESIIGRADAESFIAYYNPQMIDGWELVIAATVIYGQYLEGGLRGNRKYVVISSIFDDLEADFGAANVKTFEL